MRLPVQRASAVGDGSLGMMPMIDVVFLLLVYFVWTSSFDIPELDLPGSIADAAESAASSQSESDADVPAEAFDEIVVRIYRNDAVESATLNGQPLANAAELSERLSNIVALGVQPPVIIDPDARVSMRTAVEYYDAALAGGADRVLFAVEPE